MRRSSKDAWYSINLIPKNIILVGPFVQLHSVSFWECFAYEILNQTIDQWLLHFYTKIRTKIIKTHGDLQWDAAVKRRLMEYLLSTFVHKFSKFISDELIKQEMVTSDRRGQWPVLHSLLAQGRLHDKVWPMSHIKHDAVWPQPPSHHRKT